MRVQFVKPGRLAGEDVGVGEERELNEDLASRLRAHGYVEPVRPAAKTKEAAEPKQRGKKRTADRDMTDTKVPEGGEE